ncbi:MAG: substrate-binding domain-containing protein, partial [Bacteroidota bacterium]
MNSWLKVLSFSGILILASCSSPSGATQELSQDSTSAQTSTPNPEGENSIRGEIFITVDESLQPIIDTEIFSFMAVHPEATIHPIYLPGEEAVARMMQSDSFRLAITTRILTGAENSALKAEIITPDYATLGYDAVAIFVHQDNPLLALSEAQAIDILNGKLRNWRQLGLDQGKDLQLVFDHAQSGVLRFLRDSVLKGQALSTGNVFAQRSTPEMMAYVAENPQAIGFGGISWISDRDDPIVDSLMD